MYVTQAYPSTREWYQFSFHVRESPVFFASRRCVYVKVEITSL